MAQLDKLLYRFNQVNVAGVPVAVPQPTATQNSPTPPTVLNLASGLTAAYNPATNAIDITALAGSGLQNGQATNILVNGLNSNIQTNNLPTLRFTGPTAAFSVGGFVVNGSVLPGQSLTVVNTTTQPMTIVHEDASSTAAYRIDCQSAGAGVTLLATKRSATFVYDGTTLRWVLQNVGLWRPDVFNVLDFGARGDGVTDDSAAIQAAITACSGIGGIVYFPPATYAHSQTINIPQNVTLKGAEGGQMLGSGYTGCPSVLLKTTPGNGLLSQWPVNMQTPTNVKIKDLTLANSALNSYAYWKANTAYTSGTIVRPWPTVGGATGIAPVLLKCVSNGTSGNFQPIGQLASQFPSPTVTLTFTGQPSTDALVDIYINNAATFNWTTNGWTTNNGPVNIASAVNLPGTNITAHFSTTSWPSLQQLTYYTTPSFKWSLCKGTNISDGVGALQWQVIDAGAAFCDISGANMELDNVYVPAVGYAIGAIFDQSEEVHIRRCNFQCFAGVWLVNGQDHVSSTTFGTTIQTQNTNRITIESSTNFNGGIGIVDDGGADHSFIDCNYNGGGAWPYAIAICAAYPCKIDGGDVENYVKGAFKLSPFTYFARQPAANWGPTTIENMSIATGSVILDATYPGAIFYGATNVLVRNNNISTSANPYVIGGPSISGLTWDNNNVGGVNTPIIDAPAQQGGSLLIIDQRNSFNAWGTISIQAANSLVPKANFEVAGSVAFRAYALSLSSAVNSNISLGSLQMYAAVEITNTGGNFLVTGLANGTDGQIVELLNVSAPSKVMTITHNDNRSSVGQRIYCLPSSANTDCTFAKLRFSASQNQWYLIGSA